MNSYITMLNAFIHNLDATVVILFSSEVTLIMIVTVSLPDSLIETPVVSSNVTLTLLLVLLKPVTVSVVVCLFPRYS